jgi:putative copper resistance protein D
MEALLPQVVATSLINLSLALVVGALAALVWLMKEAAPWREQVSQSLYRVVYQALIACACALLLSLWAEAAAMADVPLLDAGPAFREMLKSTHYGHAGVAAIVVVGLAMAAHLALVKRDASKTYAGMIAACLVLFAAARVSIGHAFEHGPFSLPVVLELVHVLMMALWTGAVFVAGWLVLPIVQACEQSATTHRASLLNSLSDWATVALLAILVTGAYNAYRVIGTPGDVVSTFYGNVLLFKLAMVVTAILLGGYNKFTGLPAALSFHSSEDSSRALRKVIAVLRIESFALFFAVVAAAVLTGSAPPA